MVRNYAFKHDNIKDMVLRWRHPVSKTIHSDEKISEIRRLFKTGKYKQIQLAKKFNVEQSLVSRWVRYKRRGQKINPKLLKEVF
jgi:transposase-like protein